MSNLTTEEAVFLIASLQGVHLRLMRQVHPTRKDITPLTLELLVWQRAVAGALAEAMAREGFDICSADAGELPRLLADHEVLDLDALERDLRQAVEHRSPPADPLLGVPAAGDVQPPKKE